MPSVYLHIHQNHMNAHSETATLLHKLCNYVAWVLETLAIIWFHSIGL